MSDLRSTLTGIYQRHQELTPQIVVDEARPKGAPLHDRFEWNDKIAGEAYRRVQAAQLIRSVRIEFISGESGERKFVRGFHSLREAGDPTREGYAPTDEIAEDELATKILLRQFEREAADLKRKYGHLMEYIAWLRGEMDGLAS